MDIKRIEGCLFGMALGDALGAETEFLNVEAILQRFPPSGPIQPEGSPARVTDDTQMAIAVGKALIAAPRPYTSAGVSEELSRMFIGWYDDPDNNRAPGHTCLTACEDLLDGKSWIEASQISSKGCGANMRVMPVGVIDVDPVTRAGLAQLQAAVTHGHPTGLAASDLTAYTIDYLGSGGTPHDLSARLRAYAHSQRDIYHADWLGTLSERAYMMATPQEFISHGWNECLGALDRLDAALVRMDRYDDPCLATGKGWIAEEALATGLLCFLMFPDDPASVIRRAAVTSGDSDSIAAIAGSFVGAYHGIDAWDADWVERIEYRDVIRAMCKSLSEIKN